MHLEELRKAVNDLDTAQFFAYSARDFESREHKEPTSLVFGGAWEEVSLEKAVGRKAYLEIGLYPPGVPLVYSHDVLTQEVVDLLAAHPNNRFGLNGNNVYVIQ